MKAAVLIAVAVAFAIIVGALTAFLAARRHSAANWDTE